MILPSLKVSTDKYVWSLKIIYPTLNSKGGKPSKNDYTFIVIYTKRFEDLPIANMVSEIILLSRVTLRIYKRATFEKLLSTH